MDSRELLLMCCILPCVESTDALDRRECWCKAAHREVVLQASCQPPLCCPQAQLELCGDLFLLTLKEYRLHSECTIRTIGTHAHYQCLYSSSCMIDNFAVLVS